MHLLRIEQSGDLYQDGEAVDLGQDPGRVVVLSAADTEISLLAAAAEASGRDADALRLANYLSLNHPYSVDLYIESTLRHARAIVVQLLGGASYWSYGVEQITALARRDRHSAGPAGRRWQARPELDAASTMAGDDLMRLNAWLIAGGMENAVAFLDHLDDMIDGTAKAALPRPLPQAGIYWPQLKAGEVADKQLIAARWHEVALDPAAPVAAVVFYRALTQSGETAPVDAGSSSHRQGHGTLPIFVASLKEGFSADLVAALLAETPPAVILNMTSFAVSDPAAQRISDRGRAIAAADAPVVQAILPPARGRTGLMAWPGSTPRSGHACGVARTRWPHYQPRCRLQITAATTCADAGDGHGYEADPGGCRLPPHWRWGGPAWPNTPAERRLALIMANYPNKDSRLANGVGLDTPESAAVVMQHLQAAGYNIGAPPQHSAAVVEALLAVPTNSGIDRADEDGRRVDVALSFKLYHQHYASLSEALRQQIEDRWGAPEDDPMRYGDGLALPLQLWRCRAGGPACPWLSD